MKAIVTLFVFLINLPSNEGVIDRILQDESAPIVDCKYTIDQAVKGHEIPKSMIKQLTLVDVEYFSFDEKLHQGQILVNKIVVTDIKEIFELI